VLKHKKSDALQGTLDYSFLKTLSRGPITATALLPTSNRY